jgi:hypothetical protein
MRRCGDNHILGVHFHSKRFLARLAGGEPFARQRGASGTHGFKSRERFFARMDKRKQSSRAVAQGRPFQTNKFRSGCTSDEFHGDRSITIPPFLSVVDNADLIVGTFTTVL